MNKKMIFAFLGLFLWACNFQDDLRVPQNEKVSSQQTEKVSDAIAFLNDVFVENTFESAAPGSNPTPAVHFDKSKIDTIYDLPDENKKPFLKLVVFKPKSYALISVIKNVKNPPVLFYGKEKFDVKNPNPGFLTYLQEFWSNAARKAHVPGPGDDKDGDGAWDDGRDRKNPKDPRSSRYYHKETVVKTWTTTTAEKQPLLKTYWYQSSPYNNTIAYHKGNGTKVGCVAIAVGQIMAYHGKNTQKTTYDWNKILDNTKIKQPGGAADFLWDVAQGVKMNYGTSASGASDQDAAYYFRDSGYRISGWFNWIGTYVIDNYDFDTVKNELNNYRPVYLTGYRNKHDWVFFYTYSGGHAWIADGYKIIERYKKIKTDTGIYGSITYRTTKRTTKMIHMNWGWGSGQYKGGWCSYDYWQTKIAQSTKNYQYKKEMITIKK